MVTGGPHTFSAGNDMTDFVAAREAGELGRPVLEFLSSLVSCEKPIVAAVANLAIGVATTMLFHFDYVVANKSARFETPFTKLGLVPEAASGLIAPSVMGHSRAFAMLVLGHQLSADEARQAGLVNKVVGIDEVEPVAMAVAHEIAALPPGAVAAARRLLKGEKDKLLARLKLEDEILKTRLKSPETGAAFDRFLSRRRE